MVADGLIDQSDERPDQELDDQRRRYYRITGFGRRVAGAEAKRLQDLVHAAREKKLIRGPETSPQGA
jgi:hypothetical protein